jgi:hypothetical protein
MVQIWDDFEGMDTARYADMMIAFYRIAYADSLNTV